MSIELDPTARLIWLLRVQGGHYGPVDGRTSHAKSMILHQNLYIIQSPGSLWTCSQLNRKRLLGTRAASLSLPMPLSGGLSSLVSLSGTPASNNPPGLLQSSAASPSGKLTVDPRASGEDVTVVRFTHQPEVMLRLDMPLPK